MLYLSSLSFTLYIYIYIYNRGAISQVPGSKTANPPGSWQRKKWLFIVTSFGGLLEVPPRAPEESLGLSSGGFWKLFLGSRTECLRSVWNKVPSDCFSVQKLWAFDCKNMQTAQYILNKSRMSSLGRTSSQTSPKVIILVPKSLPWELQNVAKIVVLR